MFCGSYPFEYRNIYNIKQRHGTTTHTKYKRLQDILVHPLVIPSRDFRYKNKIIINKGTAGDKLIKFLQKCLNKDPLKRPTVDQLLQNDQFIGLTSFGWTFERQIWIGYKKNDENGLCLIDTLPRDLIRYIITFLRFC